MNVDLYDTSYIKLQNCFHYYFFYLNLCLKSKFFPRGSPEYLFNYMSTPEEFKRHLQNTLEDQFAEVKKNQELLQIFIFNFKKVGEWFEKGKEIYNDYLFHFGRGMDKDVDAILKKRLSDARDRILVNIENTKKIIQYLQKKLDELSNLN